MRLICCGPEVRCDLYSLFFIAARVVEVELLKRELHAFLASALELVATLRAAGVGLRVVGRRDGAVLALVTRDQHVAVDR